ncbi:HAMP domain-containing protein [Leptolyngbya sp. FACHB-671]|uniref:ATP-binding protein n=1 Tax=Leptolyngbya sp. FACHB-671 TaxID=2692812 RepID=UPI001683F790|nr:ATP-binding protein [Leptolyngbya sp. FACHB-671]MBD2070576.1 HAMP domain-containing protein [Leptolyngbya sp. FACHB-671]
MKRSFRLRLALLLVLLAGSGLVGFSVVSWKLIYDTKVSRLDASLENQLRRSVRLPDGDRGTPERTHHLGEEERWQFYESMLSRELGTGLVALQVTQGNSVLYQSANWTADLDASALFRLLPEPTDLPETVPPNQDRRMRGDRPLTDRLSNFPFATRYKTSGAWRIGAIRFPQSEVAIAVSLQSIDQEMVVIRNIFLISIPVVLILVAVGAWTLSGQALRPIRQLTDAIQHVSAKGLDQRLSSQAIDVEFVELIQVFNQMLERLERSFKQASRFSADAAHELKTPLTILQGELDRTLQQAEAGSEMQQRLGSLFDEAHRLSEIVRKLLLLSLADAGQMSLYQAEVDLSAILVEMVDDLELLAPELTVQTEIADGLRVWGDRDLLIQVLQNLLSNAIKYNLPTGWLRIDAKQQSTMVLVTFSNASKELSAADRHRIFDRFHRGDPAHTRKVDGTGLGLSLAREIARAHGGDLTLDPDAPNQTSFTLSLAIAPHVTEVSS